MESGQKVDDLLTLAFEGDVKYWIGSVQYWMDSLDKDLLDWNMKQSQDELDKVNDTFEWLKESIRMLERSHKNLEERKESLRAA